MDSALANSFLSPSMATWLEHVLRVEGGWALGVGAYLLSNAHGSICLFTSLRMVLSQYSSSWAGKELLSGQPFSKTDSASAEYGRCHTSSDMWGTMGADRQLLQ